MLLFTEITLSLPLPSVKRKIFSLKWQWKTWQQIWQKNDQRYFILCQNCHRTMDDQHHCRDFLPSTAKLNEQKILTFENNSLFVETNLPQRLISLNSVALSDQWNLVQRRTRRKWLDLSGELRSHSITQPNVFKVSGDCWKGKRLIEAVLIVSYRNELFWFPFWISKANTWIV